MQGASADVHDEVDKLLTRNRIFIDRTQGHRRADEGRRDRFGATGPIARASGVVRDLRKDEPYLAYADFDFKVICSDRRRLLRPLSGADARRCWRASRSSSRRSRTSRPGR